MKSILISNLNNLGDVICSTAALDLIRRAYPDTRIGFMVKPDAEGVMQGHPLVDDLFVYRYRSGSSVSSLWSMAGEVKRKRYEMYISLDRKPRSALVAFLAGIKKRITPNRLHLTTEPRWWMPLLCNRIIEYPKNSFHSLVEMFETPIKDALGLQGRGRTSVPPLSTAMKARAAEMFAPAADRKTIGFSVKANAEMKDWPAECFAHLMDSLSESLDPFIYVTGAPGDRDYIDALLARCRVAKGSNFAGKTSLMDTVALAASSDLFITLDTGAVHLAGNSGIENLICIFTCTEPEGVLESARQARVFWTGEKCCPCSSCHYGYGLAPCQTGVTVDMVYEAAVEMLDKG